MLIRQVLKKIYIGIGGKAPLILKLDGNQLSTVRLSALLLVTEPQVFIEYKDGCAAELLPEIE